MSGRPLLVVLSGPSGAGKDAVLDALAERGHRFHRVITCTTRPPRSNERDGIDYHFVSDAEFDKLIEDGGLLEHAVVYGHRSGVPRAQVLEKLAEGLDVYVRTDVQGAASIKALIPDAVRIFIAPASFEELRGACAPATPTTKSASSVGYEQPETRWRARESSSTSSSTRRGGYPTRWTGWRRSSMRSARGSPHTRSLRRLVLR